MRKRCTLVIAIALPVLGASASCLDPTEVTLDVSTDVPCGETKGTTFAGGTLSSVETAAPSTSTARCEAGAIGTLVATPAGSKDSSAAFVVVVGVDRPASECSAANRFQGCIVQRRSLRYRPHRPIRLPVEMLLVCKDVACDATSTCARTGKCVPAAINNPGGCGADGCYPEGDGPSPSVPGNRPPDADSGGMLDDGASGVEGGQRPDGGPGGGVEGGAEAGEGGIVEPGPPPPGRLYCPPTTTGCDRGATCCWENTSGSGGTCAPGECQPKFGLPMRCNRIADCQIFERCCGSDMYVSNGVDPPVRTFTGSYCLDGQVGCPGSDICLTNQDCMVGQCDLTTTLFRPVGIYGECK